MAKPVVDRLETDLAGRADLVRLDLLGEVGQAAARRYGVRMLPTFIVVDGCGTLVSRHNGLPNPARIREAVELAGTCTSEKSSP